jgi:hypothetical protein
MIHTDDCIFCIVLYCIVLYRCHMLLLDIHDNNSVYLNSRISANVIHEVTSSGGKQATNELCAGNGRAMGGR